jgi:phosphonoacetaldehyde hydrolase
MQLGVYPMWTMVKIGDTPSDIAEGLNAGMWTIGITRTGNETGLTAAEWNDTPESTQKALEEAAGERLRAAGAHYLASSVAECDPLLDAIESRLRAGERP